MQADTYLSIQNGTVNSGFLSFSAFLTFDCQLLGQFGLIGLIGV